MTSQLPTLRGPSAAECCAPAAGPAPALDADHLAGLAKALGDPLRVRILDVLRRNDEPVCQCALIALFGVRQSLLSHQIPRPVDARPVTVNPRQNWAYYAFPADALKELTAWLS